MLTHIVHSCPPGELGLETKLSEVSVGPDGTSHRGPSPEVDHFFREIYTWNEPEFLA